MLDSIMRHDIIQRLHCIEFSYVRMISLSSCSRCFGTTLKLKDGIHNNSNNVHREASVESFPFSSSFLFFSRLCFLRGFCNEHEGTGEQKTRCRASRLNPETATGFIDSSGSYIYIYIYIYEIYIRIDVWVSLFRSSFFPSSRSMDSCACASWYPSAQSNDRDFFPILELLAHSTYY